MEVRCRPSGERLGGGEALYRDGRRGDWRQITTLMQSTLPALIPVSDVASLTRPPPSTHSLRPSPDSTQSPRSSTAAAEGCRGQESAERSRHIILYHSGNQPRNEQTLLQCASNRTHPAAKATIMCWSVGTPRRRPGCGCNVPTACKRSTYNPDSAIMEYYFDRRCSLGSWAFQWLGEGLVMNSELE